ncbi:serine/threonine protein kinase [Fischerella thermalis]|uniref:serine/threonine protein kinase n=1 Tax=Fischerella thermalis TaxID=372787 RepID=UPI000C80B63A|nr:serine/threonine-protein kinase [Fischerella thermalis]PLZ81175.1 hypothetical protein CBP20_09415 [Fischerella thermalis WC213]PMB41441.1 hypothetical protein CEN40_20140 [Fischerella thermalis CCMEE 5205]
MVWVPGQKLQGDKYIIEQVLGQGGFGITYKARHTFLNNLVVIKTPNETLRYDPEYPKYVKRFIEEGRRLEKLSETQHPNIVRIRDLFHEGGIYCLVMDFVQGESLFQLVQQRGALPSEAAIKCIHQIGEALKVVHQAGLVHRDAHPGNIMVQQDGKAVLIDFGIAGETIPTTVSSKVFVNPAFAPYEQMRSGREPCVDIYSLAASLYYAVTGQLPSPSLDRKLYSIPLIPPQQHIPSISDDLNQAILKGMELEPQDRPQTMQEWLEMLAPKQVVSIGSPGYQLRGGKYTIERTLAQGGFGITYLARNDRGEWVVIKTLNETVQRRPDFAKLQEDFVREALRLAKCNHPHIVRVDDVFQEGQLWCMVMEYIQGENLTDRVVNRGILSQAEALGYIRQIGEALTVVHNNGLLHRDIKPANIIVRANQQEAVLIDFGIAREFTPDLTQSHTANLTHCFAPVEQYVTVAKRGAYTDVYALAATLYFLLTKTLPPPAPLRADGTETLQPPQGINPSISDWVNRAILEGMEVDAQNRPQSMQQWLGLLKEPVKQVVNNSSSQSGNLGKSRQTQNNVSTQTNSQIWQSSKNMPWGWLTGLLLSYSALGYLSSALGYLIAPLAFWAVVWAIAGARVVAGTSVWAETMLVFVALMVAIAIAITGDNFSFVGSFVALLIIFVIGIVFEVSKNLIKSFSRFHIFLILAATSLLSLGLGWLSYKIFPIFK